MKKQTLVLVLMLLCAIAFSQSMFIDTSLAGQGMCTFSLSNVSQAWPNPPNHVTQVSYFWNFGDGKVDTSPNPVHTYMNNDGVTTFEPYVEITPMVGYTDDDVPKRFYFNNDNGARTINVNPIPLIAGSVAERIISVSTNRSLVLNDNGNIVTYIISYEYPRCEKIPSIIFRYPSNKLELEIEGGITLPTQPILYSSLNPYIGGNDIMEMKWKLTDFPDGNTRHILIRMKVKNNVAVGDNVAVDVILKDETGNGTLLDLCDDASFSLTQTIKQSHDPNVIVSSIVDSCSYPLFKKIKYEIMFQNIGNVEVTWAEIKNYIPSYFDLSSIVVLGPKSRTTSLLPILSYNPDDMYFECTLTRDFFSSLGLRGINESNFGSDFFYNDTWDTLVYEISLKDNIQFVDCDAIVNTARIQFDSNDSMWTVPCINRFGCISDTTKCDSCGVSEVIKWTAPALVYDKKPITLVFDITQLKGAPSTYTYNWYPSYGLSDPHVQNPIATPCEDVIYYLVATSNDSTCHRLIFECPLKVEHNCNMAPSFPWWVWMFFAFLIALLAALAFFRF